MYSSSLGSFVFVRVRKRPKLAFLKFNQIEDKAARKAKTSELNIEYFAAFIKELRKTTPAVGYHIMAVGFEEIVKEIIAASGAKSWSLLGDAFLVCSSVSS